MLVSVCDVSGIFGFLFPLGDGNVECYYQSELDRKFSLDVDGHYIMSEQDYDYYMELFTVHTACEQFLLEMLPCQVDRYHDMMDSCPDGSDSLDIAHYRFSCLNGIMNGGC